LIEDYMELKKNIEIELEITGTTHDGSGVGRYEEFVIFVPFCAEGELVRAQILSVKKKLAFARLLEVKRKSTVRIEPDCPVFYKCGGCAFRHISYDEELRIKELRVADALTKIGKLDIKPEEILGSNEIGGYRNKAQYPVGLGNDGGVITGFFAPRSHRIINCMSCRLQPVLFENILKTILQWMESCKISSYDERTGAGLVRHIYIRRAMSTGQTVVCLVINADNLPDADKLVSSLKGISSDITGIILNINKAITNVILGAKCHTLWGSDRITDTLGSVKFEISPLSFYQVNSSQARRLYEIAESFAQLTGTETLLDMYCGAGTIGLFMAHGAKQVIGVEVVPQAIDDAKRNAAINGTDNARFICADAGEAADKLFSEGGRPDIVVLDPPRKGCDTLTINSVVAMNPKRVVYVSCDPATLARDLALFGQKGYNCERVKPVDMFPRTAHVECVALMSRVEK
jgi:23S rRNA (uracil1939-C5)-methyltransferase